MQARGLPTRVTSEADLNALVNAFGDVVKGLELWQYYVLDVKQERDAVWAALSSCKYQRWPGPDIKGKSTVDLAELIKSQGKINGLGALAARSHVYVDAELAASLVTAAFEDVEDLSALADAWIRVVDVINVPLYREWEDDINAAVDNVRSRVRYTRLDAHGPKLGEISQE